MAFPALQRPPMAGAIGLTAAGAPARFANVVVEDHVPGLEADSAVARGPVPEGLITRWRVSSSFPEARIDSLSDLDPGLARELRWDTLGAGPRGIADIARLRSRDDGRNTAIAAATLRVRDARRVRVRFGFSDRLQLFLDGRPVYRGADGWRSRDYRFLGTVGLFDEVVLDLEPGDHELWFAVSEDFGGWGVVAQVVDGEVGAPVDGDLGDGG